MSDRSRRGASRNAGDARLQDVLGRQQRDREERFLGCLKAVIRTPEGRFVFAELLERGRIHATVFNHSGSDMYFAEGRRNFALEIEAALVDADEDRYEELIRELRALKRSERAEADAIAASRETGPRETR